MKAKEQSKSEFGGKSFYHQVAHYDELKKYNQKVNEQEFVVPWQLSKKTEMNEIFK